MREKILKEINEDILIILEGIALIQQIKNSNPFKKQYLEQQKQNLDWTLKLKKKYETI